MTAEAIFQALQDADIGAYAVTLDQRIVFWNRSAEQILGHTSDEVLGRRCYEVLAGTRGDSLVPACINGCPSMGSIRSSEIPQVIEANLLRSTGDRLAASVTPMVVAGDGENAPVLVHLFQRAPAAATDEDASDSPAASRRPTRRGVLAPRELQVLRLVARGRSTQQIADELEISPHTVRNHVRHFRRKLEARTKLDAVMTAMRLGLLDQV